MKQRTQANIDEVVAPQDWVLERATHDEWPAVVALLSEAGLPLEGAREHLMDFVVARGRGMLVGCVGLERYGNAALLRSVAVNPSTRGRGLGTALVQRALEHAQAVGVSTVGLLTTTAVDYFPRFGFHAVTREALPGPIHQSEEYRSACPESATAMVLTLPRAES